MLGWAIGIGLLVRSGHYLLAALAGIPWPVGLNIVLGSAIWIGHKLQSGRDGRQTAERARAQRKFLLMILRRSPAHLRQDTLEAAARAAWSEYFGPDDESSQYVARGAQGLWYVLQAHGNAFTVAESDKQDHRLDPPTTFFPNSAAQAWTEYSHVTWVGVAYDYDTDPAKLAAYVARLTATLCDDQSIAVYHPATRRLWKLVRNTIDELTRNPMAFFATAAPDAH